MDDLAGLPAPIISCVMVASIPVVLPNSSNLPYVTEPLPLSTKALTAYVLPDSTSSFEKGIHFPKLKLASE